MGRSHEKQKVNFEKRVQDATNDLDSGKFDEISEAAEAQGIALNTLKDRLKGGLSRQKARAVQQKFSVSEENAIQEWILKLDDWGFPPHHQYVKDMALDFLWSHGITTPTLGRNWLTRYLARHPILASKFSTRLDKQRSYASNPRILQDFFEKIIKEHGILPENIYNMDEKGFLMGRSSRVKVICRKGKKRNFKTQERQRELITVLETVSAGGTATPPMIVYKGEAQYAGWHALVKKGDKAYFSRSPTGWSNSEIGLSYLEKNFEPNTVKQAAGKTRLLILDGHVSHCTWQFFAFCLSNIIPLCLPAHSTHLLQPSDVGLFGPLQHNYGTVLDGWLQNGNVGIHKGTFYPLLLLARELTYTKKNILSAFEATGISPINPRRVVQSGIAKATESTEKQNSAIPRTPKHGKSIASHTRHTLALLGDATPKRKHIKTMVEKLATAAAEAAAQVVILQQELEYLRKKNKAAADSLKVQSRKVLSKALVVSTEDVVRLREEWEEKEKIKEQKAIAKTSKATAASNVSAAPAKPKTVQRKATPKLATSSAKPRGRPKKSATIASSAGGGGLGMPVGGGGCSI